MMICQRAYGDYYTIAVNADDNVYTKRIVSILDTWNRIQPNLSPKTAEIYQISPDCPVIQICEILDSKKF